MAPQDFSSLSTSQSLEVALESPSEIINLIEPEIELDDDLVDPYTLDYNNRLEIKAHNYNNYLISPIESV